MKVSDVTVPKISACTTKKPFCASWAYKSVKRSSKNNGFQDRKKMKLEALIHFIPSRAIFAKMAAP